LDRCFSKSKTSNSDNNSVTYSNDMVTFLKEQILAKDELIKNLTQLVAMKEQQNQMLLEAPKKKKRWGWW